MFQSVHRLFGVKHVQNLLKGLSPHDQAWAVKSIKFHAAMREKYPVHGCLVEIQQLTYQIQAAEQELQVVLQHLAYYRQQNQNQNQNHRPQEDISPVDDYLSQIQLGMAPPGNGNMPIVCHDSNPPQHYDENFEYNNSNLGYKENINDVDSFWIQQQTYCYNNNNNNANSMVMQSQTMAVPEETNQDYNEMHSFFDNIDDRQSYIGSKEAYESSLESSLKDSKQGMEQMADNELKSAAARFSLTSVN
ncbi:hypothetical protein DH2020_048273 [Rehmannia glutinosa]|uniref:LOB domain-containing protein n=1 Tax=Rehmannia glutinosa TaxID=99300 RepID=A0ABR0U650_REHGL